MKRSELPIGRNFFSGGIFLFSGFLLLCLACAEKKEALTRPHYAKGFQFEKQGENMLVVVTPFNQPSYRYLLVPRGKKVSGGEVVIEVPIHSLVCTSTSHIPFIEALRELPKITGFPSLKYISSPAMRARIDSGKVTDVGIDYDLNTEKLLVLQPEIVMTYPVSGGGKQLEKLRAGKIPVLMNGDYLEEHPLGGAEWIRLIALLFGKEREGDSIFAAIEKNYFKSIKSPPPSRPTLMSGIIYGDLWFAPGGKSYLANMFEDAGYRYLWKDDLHSGSFGIPLETVYAKAKEAEFWIGVGNYTSLSTMKSANTHYSLFRAFGTHHVFSYYNKENIRSQYLEQGYFRPDKVVRDLRLIREGKEDSLYFFKRLE